MRLLALAAICLASPLAAQREPTASSVGVFAELQGHWSGPAWYLRGPQGRVELQQQEWVGSAAGGTVITVRGLGTMARGTAIDTMHNAFAVIHPNHEKTGVMMRAFTAQGLWLDPAIVLTARGYTWTMPDPRVGEIRYEMTIDDQGRWVENGFLSRDGGTMWTPFMGMVLTRTP